jgi:serine protease Do
MVTLLQRLNEEIAAVVAAAGRSLVKIGQARGNGAGSGVILQGDGLILTNAHVIRPGPVTITLADERSLPAKLLVADPALDLAVLAVAAASLAAIELGDSKKLRPGELVFALGHPWGVPGAVSAGSVIAVGRPPEIPRLGRDFIQVSLQLRPGHSGGPMIDAQGRLVGLNTMITGPEVGLAVPVHLIKAFLHQHLGDRTTSRPLGPNPAIRTL